MMRYEASQPAVRSYKCFKEDTLIGHLTKYNENAFMFFPENVNTPLSMNMLTNINQQLAVLNGMEGKL